MYTPLQHISCHTGTQALFSHPCILFFSHTHYLQPPYPNAGSLAYFDSVLVVVVTPHILARRVNRLHVQFLVVFSPRLRPAESCILKMPYTKPQKVVCRKCEAVNCRKWSASIVKVWKKCHVCHEENKTSVMLWSHFPAVIFSTIKLHIPHFLHEVVYVL